MHLTSTIIHQNVNGIRTHTQEKIHTLTQAYIISLQDTKLRPGHDILPTLFPDYIIHEHKHEQNTGIALLIHNSIKHTLISKYNNNGHKAITIKIQDKQIFQHDLYITSYFVPPTSSRHKTLLNTSFIKTALKHKHAILTGDLNAHHTDIGCTSTNQHGTQLRNLLHETDLTILNDTQTPTFTHTGYTYSDCLDYFISTKHLLSSISSCSTQTNNGSDHLPLTLTLRKQNKTGQRHSQNTYNYRKTNWQQFTQHLNTCINNETNFPTTISADNTEKTASLLTQHTQAAIAASTPRHRTPNNAHPRLPTETLRLIASRRHLQHIQRTQNSHTIRQEINEINKAITKSIQQTKQTMEQTKINIIKQGPRHKRFWPTLQSLINPTANFQTNLHYNGQELTTPQQKSDAFAAYYDNIFTNSDTQTNQQHFHQQIESQLPIFHSSTTRDKDHPLTKDITIHEIKQILKSTNKTSAPGPDFITYETLTHYPDSALRTLTQLYNNILDTAHIPSTFKHSIITVIPKPNKDRTKLNSYRPITLTSTLGKLLEKIIATRLTHFATQNNIIKTYQTGFRKHRNAEENTTHLIQTTIQAFNQNKCKILISLDLKQAFDRTWHSGLLHTIHSNTSTHFTKIIHSFLTNRKINIRIQNTLSTHTITPTQGVPQGSPLSPTLFNIYISTAPHATNNDIHTYNYADDTSFTSTADNPKQAWSNIQPLLHSYITWTQQYKLNIQTDKTQIIFLTRRRCIQDTQYPTCTIQNKNIARSNHIHILGTHIDTHLTMKHHIAHIDTGTHYKINQIRQLFTRHRQIHPYIGTLLYKTIIRTKFTYATPILLHIKPSLWRPLHSTEHRALRAALRTGIKTKISTLYKRTNINNIEKHYMHTARNTLTRYIKTKNKTILSTLFNKNRKQNITYWHPPLDKTFDTFSTTEQAHMTTDIQNILQNQNI